MSRDRLRARLRSLTQSATAAYSHSTNLSPDPIFTKRIKLTHTRAHRSKGNKQLPFRKVMPGIFVLDSHVVPGSERNKRVVRIEFHFQTNRRVARATAAARQRLRIYCPR